MNWEVQVGPSKTNPHASTPDRQRRRWNERGNFKSLSDDGAIRMTSAGVDRIHRQVVAIP